MNTISAKFYILVITFTNIIVIDNTNAGKK